MRKIITTTALVLCSTHLFASDYVSSPLKDTLQAEMRKTQKKVSYNYARKVILGGIYIQREVDTGRKFLKEIYCGKKLYSPKIKQGKIPNNNLINVEHVWPQSKFSKKFSKSYQKSDLHHLLPADSRANSTRGNFEFANLDEGRVVTPECTLSKFDGKKHLFEVPNEVKGDVARSMFYFSVRYRMPIGNAEEAVLREWNYLDPVSQLEKQMHEEKASIQKNRNPFIDNETLVNLITDF